MIRDAFAYHRPETAADAAALLARYGRDAAVLSGGTVLVPRMSRGECRPKAVLDLSRAGLKGVTATEAGLAIGTCASYADVARSRGAADHAPLLVRLAGEITGGAAITEQGTLGGSACYANPASDVPACLVALDARMIARSPRGERTIAAAAFFTGAFRTALADDELLTTILLPSAAGRASGYRKLKFCTSSWPIATASCLVSRNGDGRALSLRLVLGGVSPLPVRYDLKVEGPLDAAGVAAVVAQAAAAMDEEWSDELCGPGYRRAVAPTVARRALEAALREEAPA